MTPVSIQAELVLNKAAAADEDKKNLKKQCDTKKNNDNNNNNNNSQQQQQPNNKTTTTMTTESSAANNDDEDDSSNLDDVWDVVASFSILFLWFQRSTFGFVSIFLRWSLVLGHCCLQFCLFRAAKRGGNNNNSAAADHHHHHHQAMTSSTGPLEESNQYQYQYSNNQTEGVRKYFHLMQSLLFGSTDHHGFKNISVSSTTSSSHNSGSSSTHNHHHHHHKQMNNGAWPPPALVALALLTILALIVHPDGMTWIVLRKIRDTFVALLQSSTSCWAIMIRDYGVLGTVSASASITLVLIVAIAMHKAFLSNCCGGSSVENVAATTAAASSKYNRRGNALTEKKRRRRGKGGGGHRGRIKGGPNSNPTSSSSSSPSSSSSSSPLFSYLPRLPKVEEMASDGGGDIYNRPFSSVLKMIFQEQEEDEPHTTKSLQVPQDTVDLDTKRILDHHHHHHHHQEEEGASIMTSPSALESVVSEDYEAKGRTPVPSVCTVDTTAMADDISCGSFSVRSQQQPHQQQQPVRQTNNRTCNENGKAKGNATRGGKQNNKANRGQKQQQQQQQQQQKKAVAQIYPVATTTTKSRADALKTAKALKTPALATEGTPMKFDQFRKHNGQKRNLGGGKGRAMPTQNPRESRGKNGRAVKNQKNQPTAQTPHHAKSKTDINGISSSKTKSSPAKNTPSTVPNGSPLADAEGKGNIMKSNDLVDNRLSPFSPSSQSLFSCEIGASGWSLPTLPPVVQPKTLSPSLSYKTNPFVVPYNQMPAAEPGRTTPVVHSAEQQVGLWNSGQPSTPSTVASTVVSATDLMMKPSITTTPNRPLRPPPGLPTPPGFSEAHLAQPILTNASDLFTPLFPPEKPTLIDATTTTIGTPNNNVGRSALPHTWSSSSTGLGGGGGGGGVQSACALTTTTTSNPLSGIQRNSLKENPFAEHPDDAECRIEAELQELGGRMIGSVLDY